MTTGSEERRRSCEVLEVLACRSSKRRVVVVFFFFFFLPFSFSSASRLCSKIVLRGLEAQARKILWVQLAVRAAVDLERD